METEISFVFNVEMDFAFCKWDFNQYFSLLGM
jgi:hypothetical protein